MPINSEPGHIWAVNYGDEGRPAGVGPVWIENIDALIPSGSGGSTYTGGNGIEVDNENDTISLDDEAQAAIDSYVTNSGSFLTDVDLNGYATESFVTNEIEQATSAFITSADVPEPPTIAFENNGVLDTDYNGIKISNDSVGNEHVNLKKGESWYNHGLLVPTSPGNDKYLTTTSSGHLSWENKPDISDMATQTWTSQNFFPIDGLQVVGSSAEASGANIIYIVSGSNA